ncbi:MAG: Hsp20/alpha crystallin family protein [Planctomycetota bacterium]|jgi:HSP20 family protein
MLLQEFQETMQHGNLKSMSLQFGRRGESVVGAGFRQFSPSDSWAPPIDVYEDDAYYYIVADIAGMCPDEMSWKVDSDSSSLTIRGHRPSPGVEAPQGNIRVHTMMIDHGPFSRTIPLPDDAEWQSVTANYRCGLLWITLPKRN